ncbi:MAG: DUF4878 domain-containing protein [Candidatus Sericytochromatia bacterium]
MSNPSGPDQDDAATPEQVDVHDAREETAEEAVEPSESPTEVISTGEPEPQFESAEPTVVLPQSQETTQPRYTAPSGFDARSTEVIRTTPEPPTDIMAASDPPQDPSAAASAVAARKPVGPQAIPPRSEVRRHRSWGLVAVLILVIAALAAIAVLGTIWITHKASPKVSQEDMIRQTIEDFDNAIQDGNLAELRSITCGTSRDSYVRYDDKQWAATHSRVKAAKRYPMVAEIKEVVVNDKHAEANVTTFMAYEPQVRSTRSFDLQFIDGRWKICDGPVN